jgi:hypothetical protein
MFLRRKIKISSVTTEYVWRWRRIFNNIGSLLVGAPPKELTVVIARTVPNDALNNKGLTDNESRNKTHKLLLDPCLLQKICVTNSG